MAFEEQKREDLLNDATAFSWRIAVQFALELDSKAKHPTRCEEFFAGKRENGGWSFYFDEQPVVQMNASGEVRRLFIHNRKLSAEAGRLVELHRERLMGRIELQRTLVSDVEQTQMLETCQMLVRWVLDSLQNDVARVSGQIPDDQEVLLELKSELNAWLEQPPRIAASAHALA